MKSSDSRAPQPGHRPGRPPAPTAPFRPTTFKIGSLSQEKTTRTRSGQKVRCWDVVITVDGRRTEKRYAAPDWTAPRARAAREALLADWQDPGKLWDPARRHFIDAAPTDTVTVADWLTEFWDLKSTASWGPSTRTRSASSIRSAIENLTDGTPPPDTVKANLAARFTGTPTPLPDTTNDWLAAHSKPIRDVTADDLQHLVTIWQTNQLTNKPTDPTTQRRNAAPLKQAWKLALARGKVDRDPWAAVIFGDRTITPTGGVKKSTTRVQRVDKHMVLTPLQVVELATEVKDCSGHQPYDYFVKMLGLCGLRFSEAAALQLGDLQLTTGPDGNTIGWVNVARTIKLTGPRWNAPGEDPTIGPLKGRDSTESRTVPIPTTFANELRTHTHQHKRPTDPLFAAPNGATITPKRLNDDAWAKAVQNLHPTGPLARLTRHDLRHAACSAWLLANVPVKVAQEWSGHKQLSTFLDIYQGIMPGSAEQSAGNYINWLGAQGI